MTIGVVTNKQLARDVRMELLSELCAAIDLLEDVKLTGEKLTAVAAAVDTLRGVAWCLGDRPIESRRGAAERRLDARQKDGGDGARHHDEVNA